MLVILMLSTIALFTTPSLSSWLHRNQVEVAAQDFLSHIAYARQQAITLGNPVVLCRTDHTGQCSMPTQYDPNHHAVAQNWGDGYAIRIHPSAGIAPWFAQALLRIWQPHGDITITSSPLPLIFRPPIGQVTGMRHFEFAPCAPYKESLASMRRCIYIAAGGRARLEQGACKST